MPSDKQNYAPTEKDMVMHKYEAKQKDVQKALYKRLNSASRTDNMLGGMIIGSILGAVFGVMNSWIENTEQKHNSHSVVQMSNTGETTDNILRSIAIAVLLSLGVSGLKSIEDKDRNYTLSARLASNTFKRFFDDPLLNYYSNATNYSRNRYLAAAFIINNMPVSDVDYLCALAKAGLKKDKFGRYTVYDESLAIASDKISSFIKKNLQIEYNILRIMNGNEPTTYFLHKLQKTR